MRSVGSHRIMQKYLGMAREARVLLAYEAPRYRTPMGAVLRWSHQGSQGHAVLQAQEWGRMMKWIEA